MINFSLVNCINEHRQIHVGTHNLPHVQQFLFDLTIMLYFLVIININTFDLSCDGHI
jgi:hypothetical protein